MKIEFPKYMYHKTESPVIVHSLEEKLALGKGWQESPFEADHSEEVEPVEHAEEHEHGKKPRKKKGHE